MWCLLFRLSRTYEFIGACIRFGSKIYQSLLIFLQNRKPPTVDSLFNTIAFQHLIPENKNFTQIFTTAALNLMQNKVNEQMKQAVKSFLLTLNIFVCARADTLHRSREGWRLIHRSQHEFCVYKTDIPAHYLDIIFQQLIRISKQMETFLVNLCSCNN